jgi:hypothetical protein
MVSYELLTPYIDVWMDHCAVRAVLTSRTVRTNKKLRLQEEHGVDGLSGAHGRRGPLGSPVGIRGPYTWDPTIGFHVMFRTFRLSPIEDPYTKIGVK